MWGGGMKLDISKALGRTFAFIFGNILDVLRIIWLPTAIQLTAFFLLMPGYVRGTAALAVPGEPEEAAEVMSKAIPAFGLLGLFMLIAFATSVAMVIGLTRLVLNGEKPRLPFYAGWGADEWRLAGGWALFFVVVGCLVIALQFGGLLLRGVLGQGPQAGIIVLLVNLILLGGIVWVSVRLSLLAPATVVNRKIGLGISWEKTDDEFWSFFGFWAIFAVIFGIAYVVLYFTYLLPPGYFASFEGMDPTDRSTVLEAMRKANDVMVRSYDLSNIDNVMRLTIGALFGPIAGAVIAVAGAAAWKVTADTPETA